MALVNALMASTMSGIRFVALATATGARVTRAASANFVNRSPTHVASLRPKQSRRRFGASIAATSGTVRVSSSRSCRASAAALCKSPAVRDTSSIASGGWLCPIPTNSPAKSVNAFSRSSRHSSAACFSRSDEASTRRGPALGKPPFSRKENSALEWESRIASMRARTPVPTCAAGEYDRSVGHPRVWNTNEILRIL